MDKHTRSRTESLLRPLGRPSLQFYLLLAGAGGAVAWFLYAWSYQLRYGMIVTGLGDWGTGGGTPWGLFIGAYIWWIGIAHGGIIISAAVRLFRLKTFKPVARLAELLTVFALSMAGLYIVIHLGRPDRMVISILRAYPHAVFSSPLAWDVTVITAYLVLTVTYLALTLRRDIYLIRAHVPTLLAPIHKLLLIGYRHEEDEKIERMAWWLALGLILLAPLFLHGGVIPWLFAVLPSMPGWYGGIQGPTFLSIALTSALGGVTVAAYIFRRIYHWEEVIPDKVFKGLGGALTLFAILFLWLQVQQAITGVFAPPIGVAKVAAAKFHAPAYWISIGLVAVAVAYLGAQLIRPALFSLPRTVIAGLMALLATLMEKTLFVVEGTMKPEFALYRSVPGSYWPSWIELSSVIATISLVIIFFTVVAKVIPIVEVSGESEG